MINPLIFSPQIRLFNFASLSLPTPERSPKESKAVSLYSAPMEHHTNSGDSSRRLRDVNSPSEEPPSNNKVKLMCSYGGKIQSRPHDHQLTYVGGDTKILAVDRGIRFSDIMSKLNSLCDAQVYLKYQLPGEDLDALVSVINDDDLDHMLLEYDRLNRRSAKPARLRLFLFSPKRPDPICSGSDDPKTNQSRDAPFNPDFLFGFDKQNNLLTEKAQNSMPKSEILDTLVPEIPGSDIRTQLQRLQMANQGLATIPRRREDNLAGAYQGGFQKIPEEALPAQPPAAVFETVSVPATYSHDNHVTSGSYLGAAQPVYRIPVQGGGYQVGHYTMRRVVPDFYREQPVYNFVPVIPPAQERKVGSAIGRPKGGASNVES